MEPQLVELLEKRACEEVLVRYCRALDWLDVAALETVFWPDAYIDYGFLKGVATEFVPMVIAREASLPKRWHYGANVMIKIDGDRGFAESYGIAAATYPMDGKLTDQLYGGRYQDDLEKRGGEWRIAKRDYILDWTQSFDHGLAKLPSGVALPTLSVTAPGHERYRPM